MSVSPDEITDIAQAIWIRLQEPQRMVYGASRPASRSEQGNSELIFISLELLKTL